MGTPIRAALVLQEHDRQETDSQDASDSLSMHSPGESEASSVAQSAKSGRGGMLREEPAMISFEDEAAPMPSSRSNAGQILPRLCPLKISKHKNIAICLHKVLIRLSALPKTQCQVS